jgi:bifunctional non-homologous end joining protein LigD
MSAERPIPLPDPMLATLGTPPAGPGWAVEYKWDGFRARCLIDGSSVKVFSRNAADVSSTFPELASIAAATGQRRLLLDGEIVALDQLGRPSFSRLQQRWPIRRRPTRTLLEQVPVCFFAFDLLVLGDEDFTARTYVERRQALSGLSLNRARPLVVPPYWDDAKPSDMLAAAAENGIEGIVAKRLESQYVSGRSKAWIKSPVRLSCELAVVGWWPPSGPVRSERIGALLLAGRRSDGQLTIVGQVGSGLSDAERRRLYALLAPLAITSPPVRDAPTLGGVHWVKPRYVGEVAFREYTPHRGLRHASWKGLRERRIAEIGMPERAAEE